MILSLTGYLFCICLIHGVLYFKKWRSLHGHWLTRNCRPQDGRNGLSTHHIAPRSLKYLQCHLLTSVNFEAVRISTVEQAKCPGVHSCSVESSGWHIQQGDNATAQSWELAEVLRHNNTSEAIPHLHKAYDEASKGQGYSHEDHEEGGWTRVRAFPFQVATLKRINHRYKLKRLGELPMRHSPRG